MSATVSRRWRNCLSILFGLASLVILAMPAQAETDLEQFDGSFLLDSGAVISGGYFVENAQGSYMYFDTETLRHVALFRAVSDSQMQSIFPPDQITVRFGRSTDGRVNRISWEEAGQPAISGRRIRPHRSREISFRSTDGTQLHGRLMLPSCPGPHPVVITIPGSGPVDRHGGALHLYFLRHGIGLLSYDKRGYSTDPGAWREPDLAEMEADVAAAYRFLREQPGIDPERLGILGNSQAGWFVPQAIASLETPPAFLIMRAGAILPHAVNQLHENRQEWRSEGLTGLALDSAADLMREIFAVAMRGEPITATDALVAPYLERTWYRTAFGDGPISDRWSDRYWGWVRRNYAVSPAEALAEYGGPILWFLGEADQNVPYVATRAAVERTLAAAPGNDHQVIGLPGAAHSFLVEQEGQPPRFSDGYFSVMTAWLDERGFTGAPCPAGSP